jgi:hypothetical protein
MLGCVVQLLWINVSSGPRRFPVLRGSLVVCALTKDIFMDLMTMTHMLTAGITFGFMFRYLTSCASHLEEMCYRFSSTQLLLLANVPWTCWSKHGSNFALTKALRSLLSISLITKIAVSGDELQGYIWVDIQWFWSGQGTLLCSCYICSVFGLLTLTFWCSLMHSLVIMSQAITISAAINSQNNMLLTLLISNNFAEIKSNVFKRVGKDNLHKMAYHGMISSILVSADDARSTKPKGHRNQTLCRVGFLVKSESLMIGALCVCLTLCYCHLSLCCHHSYFDWLVVLVCNTQYWNLNWI